MLHVSFSHAWSASKPKEEREDMEIYYSSHIFSGCSESHLCITSTIFRKSASFSWNLWIFLLKNAKIKFSICSFRRMTFLSQLVTFIREKSTGLWQALNGQTQCHKRHHWKKAPWQTYHMWTVTAQSICFSWLFDIPMNLAFQWRAVNQVIEGK